jgi:hypothetical protein
VRAEEHPEALRRGDRRARHECEARAEGEQAPDADVADPPGDEHRCGDRDDGGHGPCLADRGDGCAEIVTDRDDRRREDDEERLRRHRGEHERNEQRPAARHGMLGWLGGSGISV